MEESKKVELFNQIDFGDVDANADPNLDQYFIDNNYWDNIIKKPVYYVAGKKGTGKSALYKMMKKFAQEEGVMISNCDFGDFPFNKLMKLDDDDFSKPNQYQSIWELVILNQLIALVIKSESSDKSNIYYKKLNEYFEQFLGETVELHKVSLSHVKKREGSLCLSNAILDAKAARENERTTVYGDAYNNISAINRSLLDTLLNYFKITNNPAFIVQFDRLDDTYNQYSEIDTYLQVIISLMKIVYKINNSFRSAGIDMVKTIVYLRSDIIDEIGKRDAESARWEDFTYTLNWAIINKSDWKNPKLKEVINRRIITSLNTDMNLDNLLDSKTIRIYRTEHGIERKSTNQYMDVFQYMIELTMHRPRDVIKFCKCIQEELLTSGDTKITYRTIKNAEKTFCYWLVNAEISNEINPVVSNIDELYKFLRTLGSKPFSFSDFYLRYKNFEEQFEDMDRDELIDYLYEVGILMNFNFNKGKLYLKSKIRNKGKVDRSMKLLIHAGVWKGINA